jgi:Ca2+-binding RTX toxin-like protein
MDDGTKVYTNKNTNAVIRVSADVEVVKFRENTVQDGTTVKDNTDDKTITTEAGNDKIYSSGKNSTINSGAGDDRIDVVGENSKINAGEGNDVVLVSNKINGTNVDGGAGNDRIVVDTILEKGTMSVKGGEGQDVLVLGGSAENYTIVTNNDGSKVYTDKATGSVINIAADIETINFKGTGPQSRWREHNSNKTILTSTGNDLINTTGDNNKVQSGAGNDTITASGSNTNIQSGEGNDIVRLRSGSRGGTIDAGTGNDSIFIDKITTQGGVLDIDGGAGYDILSLAGPMADYTITENKDGSKTYIHRATGTRIEIASDIEDVKFG